MKNHNSTVIHHLVHQFLMNSLKIHQKQNTLQTTKKTDSDYHIKEGVQNLVSTSDGTSTFGIAPNAICRLRIYLWLEGQDVDCINYASHGGGVKVNIGLVKGSTIGATEAPGE